MLLVDEEYVAPQAIPTTFSSTMLKNPLMSAIVFVR